MNTVPLRIEPLTPARWPDLEALFAARGCAQARGCWCMCYRRSGREPPSAGLTPAQANRQGLQALVDAGVQTGLIAYRDGLPVGWVAVGPREHYPRLDRSPVMRRVDAAPVWSVVCFVVPAPYRGQGVARALLAEAIRCATQRGATQLEAYPVDPPGRVPDNALWFGPKSLYDGFGFAEVARRRPSRPVMRLALR